MRYGHGQICCVRDFRVLFFGFLHDCVLMGIFQQILLLHLAALQDFIVAGYCLRVLYSYNTMEGTLKVVI